MQLRTINEVLRVTGVDELAADNFAIFRKDVVSAFQEGLRYIEIDMSRVHFIDSFGVGALIGLNRLCRERQGHLRVLDPSLPVEHVLRMTRLTKLLEVVVRTPAVAGQQGRESICQNA